MDGVVLHAEGMQPGLNTYNIICFVLQIKREMFGHIYNESQCNEHCMF